MLLIRLRLGLTIAVAMLFGAMAREAMDFQTLARYFPLTVTVAGGAIAILSAVFDVGRLYSSRGRVASFSGGTGGPLSDLEAEGDGASLPQRLLQAVHYLAWFVGYAVLIWLSGILIASAVFLVLFLRIEGRAKWRLVLVCSASMVLLLFLTANILNLHWPTNLLGSG